MEPTQTSAQERQVVHSVAVEMGLHSMDGEEGSLVLSREWGHGLLGLL